MAVGLYSGVSGLALGTGLYKDVSGLWGGASGLINGFGGSNPFSGASLYLNFLAGAPLDSRVTFSRGSNATLVDSTGKITYAPANLFLRSEEFDNAAWLKANVTITADATTSPDGTVDADLAIPNTTTGTKTVGYQNVAMTAVSYTMSFYAKPSGYDWVYLREDSSGSTRRAYFNVSTGVVGVVSAGLTASITSVGGGWYRCGITFTGAVGTFVAGIWVTNANNTPSLTGDGTSGVFAWGAQLEPVTYQTTPSTYVATTSAAYYGPRFDYDPVTLAAKGLLIEEQRTNLLTYSEQFDNAIWTKSAATITANATAAPDGTSTADKLTPDVTLASHFAGQTVTTTAVAHTYSAYLNAVGYSWAILYASGVNQGVYFDLANGVVGSSFIGAPTSSSITPVGNGWYRCSITFTATTGTAARVYASSANTVSTFAGDGTSGIFIWGAQLEAGAFATSYIPTVASQVTRSADVATMTGTNFSSWYNQSEGTFVASYDSAAPASRYAISASDGTSSNLIGIEFSSATTVRGRITTAGVSQASMTAGSAISAGQVVNAGLAYETNSAITASGGALSSEDTSVTLATLTQLSIGAILVSNFLNGHIRQIAYYNTRLPNATLQALTA